MLDLIKRCLLPKLSKNYDETSEHIEYKIRKKEIKLNIEKLTDELRDRTKNYCDIETLTLFTILYYELKTKGDWNHENSGEYANKLCNLLKKNLFCIEDVVNLVHENSQPILVECFKYLNCKLNHDFKKHPSLIEVYCVIVKEIHLKMDTNILNTLPVALNLANDYLVDVKMKGLTCSHQLLTQYNEDINKTNYYEVVHQNLCNIMKEKDLGVTEITCKCLDQLAKRVPSNLQNRFLRTQLVLVLEEISMETNFYRKKVLFEHLNMVMSIYTIDCLEKKKSFFKVMTEHFDMCANEVMGNVLLSTLVECFDTWLTFGWCEIIKSDLNILPSMLKILYLHENEETKMKLEKTITTMICLADKETKTCILSQLSACSLSNAQYNLRLKKIIKNCTE